MISYDQPFNNDHPTPIAASNYKSSAAVSLSRQLAPSAVKAISPFSSPTINPPP
jgi:hypothetical protein